MKKILPYLTAVFIILIIVFGFQEKTKLPSPATATAVPANSSTEHNWFAPALPLAISFAGEATPLDRWEVREQLDREILFNYYWQNNILYMIKLSARYFPFIEERLKANGIPDDFKYVCVADSNLTNAVSRAGAAGFWQFMKATAPGYHVEVNETVDERYNVIKSTEAACTYFKQAYKRFGSWTAAAASYNCGMGAYQNHAQYQQSTNYYDLVLPEETQRYIFRILAFKHLLTKADSLGFNLQDVERYAPLKTRTITVSKTITDLAAFAKANGSSYKILKWLNPWLRSRSLPVKPGKTYTIILPAE